MYTQNNNSNKCAERSHCRLVDLERTIRNNYRMYGESLFVHSQLLTSEEKQ